MNDIPHAAAADGDGDDTVVNFGTSKNRSRAQCSKNRYIDKHICTVTVLMGRFTIRLTDDRCHA